MGELCVKNVSYRYRNGERMALDGVSCEFLSGEVAAVVGPSGSGKTTLLSILAGLDRPLSGRIVLNGTDLSKQDLDQYRREEVSMIFQAFQLFPLLTAVENVCYPMELLGVDKRAAHDRAETLLEKVDISPEKWGRYPSHLSGGEQQRVAIARSMASGAQVLLADEPTGNLDSGNSKKVVELLLKLAHEEGYCVVIVTHDPAIAEVSDRVYEMADGVLTERG